MPNFKDKDVVVHHVVEVLEIKGDVCLLKAFQVEGSSEIYIGIDSFGPFPRKEAEPA